MRHRRWWPGRRRRTPSAHRSPRRRAGNIARQQAGLGEARYADGAVQDSDDHVSAGGSPTSPGTVRGSIARSGTSLPRLQAWRRAGAASRRSPARARAWRRARALRAARWDFAVQRSARKSVRSSEHRLITLKLVLSARHAERAPLETREAAAPSGRRTPNLCIGAAPPGAAPCTRCDVRRAGRQECASELVAASGWAWRATLGVSRSTMMGSWKHGGERTHRVLSRARTPHDAASYQPSRGYRDDPQGRGQPHQSSCRTEATNAACAHHVPASGGVRRDSGHR